MWQSQVSVSIHRSPGSVYERLKDFTRHSEFSGGLARVEQVTDGPQTVGTRFRSEETVPSRYVSHCEITALDAPDRIAWRAWVDGVMRTEWEYLIVAEGSATRLVQVSRWWATRPVGLVMLNVHRKRNAPRENQATLERIKSVLEAEAAAA